MDHNEIETALAITLFFSVLHSFTLLLSGYIFGIMAIVLYCQIMGIDDDN